MEGRLKRLDLHLHTIPTIADSHFEFSLDKLCQYVKTANLDAIAITNHNMFDPKQFGSISEKLAICVFPGIEVNLENGHVLILLRYDKIAHSV
jgi:predicted metal-dependent phosphoesterase TrpH